MHIRLVYVEPRAEDYRGGRVLLRRRLGSELEGRRRDGTKTNERRDDAIGQSDGEPAGIADQPEENQARLTYLSVPTLARSFSPGTGWRACVCRCNEPGTRDVTGGGDSGSNRESGDDRRANRTSVPSARFAATEVMLYFVTVSSRVSRFVEGFRVED